jgi:hypothetical protein
LTWPLTCPARAPLTGAAWLGGGIPVVPPAPQPVLNPPPPSHAAPVNGARGGQVNGQHNGQHNGQVPSEANGQAEQVERRPMPQARIESQPRVEGPAREPRDGVSLRLALEEEAS